MGEIRDLYEKKFNDSLSVKIEGIVKEFYDGFKRIFNEVQKEIILDLIHSNATFLPLHYAVYNDFFENEICFMRYLGEVDGIKLFYFERDKIICEKKSGEEAVCYEINKKEVFEIICILEKKEEGIVDNSVVVPDGFFAFRHKYTFATSASDGEESVFMSAVKAESLDRALEIIPRYTFGGHANCFWDFEIYFENQWRELELNPHRIIFSFDHSKINLTLKQ